MNGQAPYFSIAIIIRQANTLIEKYSAFRVVAQHEAESPTLSPSDYRLFRTRVCQRRLLTKAYTASNSLELSLVLSFFQEKESDGRQTHQAFTPGLFQAKLPPALALQPTMGTRPIRPHTPAPAVLPRAR